MKRPTSAVVSRADNKSHISRRLACYDLGMKTSCLAKVRSVLATAVATASLLAGVSHAAAADGEDFQAMRDAVAALNEAGGYRWA